MMTLAYCLPGLKVAALRGMQTEFAALCQTLSEQPANHVSIIAPHYFGKTVMINALAKHFESDKNAYQFVSMWDLRHDTPEDDADFKRKLAGHINDAVNASTAADPGGRLVAAPEQSSDAGAALERLLGSLEKTSKRMLLLLDDLDSLAASSKVTSHVWGSLRALAERPGLRLVASSSRVCRAFVPSREARNSDFWNVFGSVVRLRPIDADGFADFTKPLVESGYAFDAAAQKQMFAWTGGVPVLMAALCKAVAEETRPGPLAATQIDGIAERLPDSIHDILADLWEDCSHEMQLDLIDLNSNPDQGDLIQERRTQALLDRGYLTRENGRPRSSCRFIAAFASSEGTLAADLRDLLRDPQAEERNFKQILQMKLSEVTEGDADIRGYIDLAIDGLKHGSPVSMVLIRSIAERAIQLAWNVEFPAGAVPTEIQSELVKPYGPHDHGLNPSLFDRPHDLYTRQMILRRAAGCGQDLPKLTKKVSRPTIVQIDYLHSLGNYGQHMASIGEKEERPVDFTFCVAACFAAIALFKRMTEDFA